MRWEFIDQRNSSYEYTVFPLRGFSLTALTSEYFTRQKSYASDGYRLFFCRTFHAEGTDSVVIRYKKLASCHLVPEHYRT
jgi:hypothetical protein